MIKLASIEKIGNEIAIRWEDGREDYFPEAMLRTYSPSAENIGERDLVGKVYGGTDGNEDYSWVTVRGWNFIGGYAVRFSFSDGHSSGIFSFEYLQRLGAMLRRQEEEK